MDIPKNSTECAFNLKKEGRQNDRICSDGAGIEIMRQVLRNMNKETDSKSNEELVEDLNQELKCEGVESCIYVSPEFIKVAGKRTADKIKKEIFKPDGPRDNKEWLSNSNIDDLLDQLEDVYPGFVHIPFQMRDFEKQETELASIDLVKEYKKGMKSFATVINTDYSDKSGSHWFCLYGDFGGDIITLEYFNSSGNYPLSEIHEWLHKTKSSLEKKLNKTVKTVIVSKNEIQKSNSECGVFCLYYIFSRLNGVPYDYFSKVGLVTDDMMYDFRKFLYRKNK